jgi:uncharacterized membrane protein YhfC
MAASHILNALLMIGLPIALGLVLARRYSLAWRLYLIGAATFVLSQAAHVPFNMLLLNGAVLPPAGQWPLAIRAVALGLSAGVFEETARYLIYRYWIRNAREWRDAVMFGAGHGGCEAVILGMLAAIGTINLLALSGQDLNALGLAPEQLALVRAQLAVFQDMPWYVALLGAVERVFAITFHIAAAVLVLQVFRRGGVLWLVAAMAWHTILNAVAVMMLNLAGPLWAEAALAGLTLVSVAIIYVLRDSSGLAATPHMGEAEPHVGGRNG